MDERIDEWGRGDPPRRRDGRGRRDSEEERWHGGSRHGDRGGYREGEDRRRVGSGDFMSGSYDQGRFSTWEGSDYGGNSYGGTSYGRGRDYGRGHYGEPASYGDRSEWERGEGRSRDSARSSERDSRWHDTRGGDRRRTEDRWRDVRDDPDRWRGSGGGDTGWRSGHDPSRASRYRYDEGRLDDRMRRGGYFEETERPSHPGWSDYGRTSSGGDYDTEDDARWHGGHRGRGGPDWDRGSAGHRSRH